MAPAAGPETAMRAALRRDCLRGHDATTGVEDEDIAFVLAIPEAV